MKSGKLIAVIAIVVISVILLTACLGSQDGGTGTANSPLSSNEVIEDPRDSAPDRSSKTVISEERRDVPNADDPVKPQPALNSSQAGPGPVGPTSTRRESTPTKQTAAAAVTTPEPVTSAQAHAAPSSLPSDTQTDTPLQSSRSVEVNLRQFRQLLPRDAIAPIYTPQFLSANQASLEPGELVIGLEIDGESKAYPIGPLVRREMVNDVIAGVPILVTW